MAVLKASAANTSPKHRSNPFHSTDANDKSGYGYDYNGYAMNPSVMFFTQETAYACKGIGKTFYSFL